MNPLPFSDYVLCEHSLVTMRSLLILQQAWWSLSRHDARSGGSSRWIRGAILLLSSYPFVPVLPDTVPFKVLWRPATTKYVGLFMQIGSYMTSRMLCALLTINYSGFRSQKSVLISPFCKETVSSVFGGSVSLSGTGTTNNMHHFRNI